jgi:hypothetical protein
VFRYYFHQTESKIQIRVVVMSFFYIILIKVAYFSKTVLQNVTLNGNGIAHDRCGGIIDDRNYKSEGWGNF